MRVGKGSSRKSVGKAIAATLPVLATASVLMLSGQMASAASYTYDADTGTSGAQDGSGLGWNTANTNWLLNGAGSDVVWPNLITDTAVFGSGGTIANAAAGTVTVGTVNVGTIQFSPTLTTGYTLATGTITLGTGITTTSSIASTISAKISGSAGLAFNGVLNAQNGVTLSGANDYTGITTLSTGGRLGTGNGTALGSSAGATASALGTNYTQVNANATVNLGNSTSEAFLINGQGSIASGNAPSALRIGNNVTLSSLVQLGSNSLIGSPFGVATLNGNLDVAGFTASFGNGNNPGTFTINGVVTGTAGGIAINSGSGNANVVNLTNAGNTYVGTTAVSAGGTLGLGGDLVLGSSTLALNGGTVRSTNATARTIANAITVGGSPIFGATTVQTGTLNFTSTTASSIGGTAKTFTTNVDTTFANGFGGTTGTLTKAGLATLFMNGTNTYPGLTTVSAGTLGGSGSFAGPVTVGAAGTLAPGNSPGVLSFGGALTLAGATSMEVNGTARGIEYDGINTTGLLTVGGSLGIVFGAASSVDVTYDLFQIGLGGETGDFASVAITGTYAATLTNTAGVWTGNDVANNRVFTFTESTGDLTVTAIPEPATLGLIGLASVGVLAGRRRRSA